MANGSSSDRLFWRVVGNAAVKPLNLFVLAAMLVAAIFVQVWIVALAVPIYAALVAMTVRDPHELQRIASSSGKQPQLVAPSLDGIDARLRPRVAAALAQEAAILQAVATLPAAPEGLADQVRTLGSELVDTARRASDVDGYLDSVDISDLQRREASYRQAAATTPQAKDAADALAEQISVIGSLTTKRQALDAEIDHVEAGLGTVRARVVQARAEAVTPNDLVGEVNDLRDRMRAMADGLAEAYGPNDPAKTGGPEPQKGA